MKTYKFEIPSSCKEVFEVKANTLEEAAQKIIDFEDDSIESYIPESEFAIEMNLESVLECHI